MVNGNGADYLIKSKKYMIILWILALFASGFLIIFISPSHKVKLGNRIIPCNPKAKISLKKKYDLRLWDYNLPLGRDKNSYRNYLQKAVLAFQKQYPNIKVEITLLDILNGPAQLAQAIHNNDAPDVYCSLYEIPGFNFEKQIPVGFFLKKEEQDAYHPNILDLTRVYGVQCYFPRWTAPLVWIGNKTFLDKAGLEVARIQSEGWNWDQMLALGKNVPEGKYLLDGSLGYHGFISQFMDKDIGTAQGLCNGLDFLETLIEKKAAPPSMEKNMLGRFLNGQIMLLAGVRPVIYSFLKSKLADLNSDWTPVILPAPSASPQKTYFTENGVICVYRNKGSVGDGQIAAAVKLGQFLSTFDMVTPWRQMMVIPASQKTSVRWREEFYAEFGEPGILNYLQEKIKLENVEENLVFQEKFYPVLQDFCNGKISKDSAKAKIIEGGADK